MDALDVERSIAKGEEALHRMFEDVRSQARDRKTEAAGAERTIFGMLMPIGRAAMEAYFAEKGTGDVGIAIQAPDGAVLRRESRLRGKDYFPVFGKIEVPRTCYRREGRPGVFPLDAQVNLPKRSYSYFLQEWMTLFDVEHPFRDGSNLFDQLLGLDLAESVLMEVGQEAAVDYDAFYAQKKPPRLEDEGEIQVVSFDGKGVPMIKAEAAKLVSKLKKGEKRQTKKEALVGVGYTVDPKVRTAEGLAETLVFPEEARKRRDREGGCGDPTPRAQNVLRFASLSRSKDEVMEVIHKDADRRDPKHRRRLAVLLDGALALWHLAVKRFKEWPGAVFILDIFHVVGYLWLAGNTLFKEGTLACKQWVHEKLSEILRGKVGRVIGGLRQILTKRKLSKSKTAALKKVVGYFHKHRRWMRYDEYLAAGLPVGTGVVESACGTLVKARMEGGGKRWSIPGAEAVLTLRSLRKSHDDDLPMYWRFRAYQERLRHYGSRPNWSPIAAFKAAA